MTPEKQIENTFIDILTMRENQWTYRSDIKTESQLWENLRGHINRINLARLEGVLLTDNEFKQVRNELRRFAQTPFMASQWLRGENGIAQVSIERDEISKGSVTLTLFSNKDIAGGISSYEVVNQVVPNIEGKTTRGDVTLLINGLPVIHIELKSELAKDGYLQAFQQIERYAQSGFFDGIYSTVQIFVVSNKVSTRYFARPRANDDFQSAKKFLFNWREPDNTPVDDLYDFTRRALSIPMAHELISRFTILVDDKKGQKFMMVLRPYQIHAIKKIMKQAYSHEGGFIWHATGSGKTITSFVATKLLAQSAISVARTIMIVDRKDLDSQTKNEFSKFASEYNTGVTSGKGTDNTLIVGIDNKRELVENFLSKKNNNTIIITTIQKLSRAIRESRESEVNKFEKLKGEYIVFIVDECHRAVSDQEMKAIKKIFPKSTWIGLTGTPIFEENKKQENGTYARTTFDQYGELLHAYTTKNAMEDKSVLDFQVEYHSLLNEEEEERIYLRKIRQRYPNDDPEARLKSMFDEIEKESLLESSDYENDDYIETMLKKIFKHQSVLEKFKVSDGMPTMSAILTTHSIAQAKRIYRKLVEFKKAGSLITGKPMDERRKLRDPDFPRVAITYSVDESQDQMIAANEELMGIMKEYNSMFGTNYTDIDLYNQNINNRLARKDAQYQKDGQWLDFVIVVNRLLTGFDAPTIQTLYVDRELRYQKLLQAFSRTNRTCPGKSIGMIVTFRKPNTMARNVRDAIKLFSNEERDWEKLVPRQYREVKQNLKAAYKKFRDANRELTENPTDIKKQLHAIKTFQTMKNLGEAIKSYEEYEVDFANLSDITQVITDEIGHIENLKAEVKEALKGTDVDGNQLPDFFEIEFSSDQRATLEEKIDSYYISQLLKDIKDEKSKQKFDEIIKNKASIVKMAYDEALGSLSDERKIIDSVDSHFRHTIESIIKENASILKVSEEDLNISFNEYRRDKAEVPYINMIIDKSTITREEFEQFFHKKFRERRRIIEEYWKKEINNKLLPLKDELSNFTGELKKWREPNDE
ncbi:type I restriction endonuclease subunit R [Lacrimispora sp.]|uniref:type I restriction endonuclease subunit R n=1 Tax=Lacrimispora sp. TaxID=2719234 RepID=UPI0028A9C1B1|nr:HsdR family type I site-specific deoxyribonuclease [Lacrimispora sp.]